MSKKERSKPIIYHMFKFFFGVFAVVFFSCHVVHTELGRYPISRIIGRYKPNQPSNQFLCDAKRHQLDTTATYSDFVEADTGETILTGGVVNITYYQQNDSRWANKNYGPNNSIAAYGCGPTVLAMIVSSMTDESYTPEKMANWAYQNGFFSQNSGSYHSIIPDGAKQFGLAVESIKEYTPSQMIKTLYTGKIVVLLMDKGHFTQGGHFIILRGTTLDGQILIADPQSLDNSMIPWDPDVLISEMKYHADAGGPMWAISMKESF